jgi:mono/diheme cytochrome c family protein
MLFDKFNFRRKKSMLNKIVNSCRFIPFLALVLLCVPVAQAQSNAEANYKAKCASCHGPDGTGSTPAGKAMKVRDFHSPEVQKETVAELADVISNGRNKMPKYSDKLKDTEIKDLAEYVHDLGKK